MYVFLSFKQTKKGMNETNKQMKLSLSLCWCPFVVQQIISFQEIEKFTQSSGEDGIVLFRLGSMVQNLPEEKANMIALALAQIPQKVWYIAFVLNNYLNDSL